MTYQVKSQSSENYYDIIVTKYAFSSTIVVNFLSETSTIPSEHFHLLSESMTELD
jgi:hypothetical protein